MSFVSLFMNYFSMMFGIIISNFWTIMSISQKTLPKRLMRITFAKKSFLSPNNYSKKLFTKYPLAV